MINVNFRVNEDYSVQFSIKSRDIFFLHENVKLKLGFL